MRVATRMLSIPDGKVITAPGEEAQNTILSTNMMTKSLGEKLR